MITPGPKAIEEWAIQFEKGFNSQTWREFTQDEAETWAMLMILHKDRPACELDQDMIQDLEENKWTGANLLWRRVKYAHTYTIDPTAALALGYIIQRPGQSTIIANYLQYKCFKEQVNHVTLEFISEKVFVMGVPTDDYYAKVWANQKLQDGSNLLDQGKYADSIRELPPKKYKSFLVR